MLKVNDKIAVVKDIYIFISVDILIMPSQGWGSRMDSKLGPMLNELIAKKWLS